MSTSDESHILYRFYDAADELLYIGITANPAARFASHKRMKPWWESVTRIEMERFDSRDVLMDAEKKAIEAENPSWNLARPKPQVQARTTRPGIPMPDMTEHVKRIVDEAPPLTDEQRDRIATILRSSRL